MIETNWVDTYWDFLDTLYWEPELIGLKSTVTDGKRTYRRQLKSYKEFAPHIQKSENPFNVIFEITFAILSPELNAQFFAELLGLTPGSLPPMKLYSRKIRVEYGEKFLANTMTPDAYFLSSNSSRPAVLAVENKFNARTSRDQFAKYLYRMFKEEDRLKGAGYSEPLPDLHLLYIYNRDPNAALFKELGGQAKDLQSSDLVNAGTNPTVYRYLNEQQERISDALRRLRLFGTDWAAFASRLDQ